MRNTREKNDSNELREGDRRIDTETPIVITPCTRRTYCMGKYPTIVCP